MESKDQKKTSPDHGGLFSVDFIPKCNRPDTLFKWPEFETFSTLLPPANAYLIANPGLVVTSCETIHLLVENDHVKEPNKSEFIQYGESFKPFVKALRLWLQPRRDGSLVPQQIAYMSFLPKLGPETGVETLVTLTSQINGWLRENPVPGKVITVESLVLRGTDGDVNVDMTTWKHKTALANFKQSFLSMFRIFYVCGEPCFDEIGFADFYPDILQEGGFVSGNPVTQQFPAVMEKVQMWITQLPSNVRFLNMQTMLRRSDAKGLNSNAYSTFYWDSAFFEFHIRFLRCAFVTATRDPVAPPSYFPVQFGSILFTPALLSDPKWYRNAKFEPESATKERMDNWVQQTRANVLAVETVIFKVITGAERLEGFAAMRTWNEMQYDHNSKSRHPINEQYIRCYRLCVDGPVENPKGFEWPRTMDDYRKEHIGDVCVIA